jgi:carbon monoxide dehydrogenase subunit G
MAIRIEERFAVAAPTAAVWEYLVDPRRVVTCLPGAELAEVVDDRTFLGNVKVRVGAVTVSYRGKVAIVDLDAAGRRVRMTGEGRESTGAGSARMTMESRVVAAPGGAEVHVQADLEVVGRIVQLGRGMIEQVGHQLFAQFAACVRATLEAEAAARAAATPEDRAAALEAAAAARPRAVHALPLFFRALWAWLLALFRRRGGGAPRA